MEEGDYTHRSHAPADQLPHLLSVGADRAMQEVFGARYSSLHVRVTNRGAFHLYSESLGYAVYDREEGYYADGEDAFDMRKTFGDFAFAKKGAAKEAAGAEAPRRVWPAKRR